MRSIQDPEPSIGELIRELRDQSTTLLRQEIELAKVETTEKARLLGRSGAILGIGGLVAYLGCLFALLGISFLLSAGLVKAGWNDVHARWLGPLIVGVVVGIAGYVMIRKGLHTFKRESLIPQQTLQSLQESQEWAKQKRTREPAVARE